ncbi:MAG: hypothetical protein ACOCRX_06370 [Candidatus Woesearchaeota archaeon]
MVRKLMIIIIFFIIFINLVVANGDSTHFRDMEFGDNKEYLEEEKNYNFERLKNEDKEDIYNNEYGIKFYRIKNNNFEIGNLKSEKIIYGFFEEKLVTVQLSFGLSFNKSDILKDMLKSRYGNEYDIKMEFEYTAFIWENKSIKAKLINYDTVERDYNFEIKLYGNCLLNDLENWQEQKQKENAEKQNENW